MGAAAVPLIGAVAGPVLNKVLGGSKQQSTTTQEMPAHITAGQQWALNRGQELGDRPYTPYDGQMFEGFNPMQENAFASSNIFGQMGLGALGHGYNALTDMTGANMMGGAYGGLMGMGMGQNPMETPTAEGAYAKYFSAGDANRARAEQGVASQADRGSIRDVAGGSYLNSDLGSLSDYMNPYTQNVIEGTTNEMDRGRQQQLLQGEAMANAAGAFGGGRHGVADAQTNAEFFRNSGNMANAMNAQAYQAASGLMGDDLQRSLQAGMANQGMDWNTQNLNAQLGSQMSQYNAGNRQQTNLYNAAAGDKMAQFNAGNRNANSMFNAGSQNQLNMFNAGNEMQNNWQNAANQINAFTNAGGIGNNMANFGLNQGRYLTNYGVQGLGAQSAAGNQIQGFGQQQRQFDYDQFREARDWRANNAQYMNDALRASQGGAGTTTQDYFGPSYLQQGLGFGSMAQGIYGMGQDNGWWGGGGNDWWGHDQYGGQLAGPPPPG